MPRCSISLGLLCLGSGLIVSAVVGVGWAAPATDTPNSTFMPTMPTISNASRFTTTAAPPTIGPSFGSCVQMDVASCQLPNSSVVNLNALCGVIQGNDHSALTAENGLTPPTFYHLNPCRAMTNLHKNCSGDVASCEESHKSYFPFQPTFENIGVRPPQFQTLMGDVLLRYSPTAQYSKTATTVLCRCDSQRVHDPTLLHLDRPAVHEVVLLLQHVCCCADACANGKLPDDFVEFGLSAGSIMSITICVSFLAYLILGALYNFRDGEHGIYLIPNIIFWQQFLHDTKLGLKYCVGMAKNTGNNLYGKLEGDVVEGSFGEEIAVNYHNPDFDRRRPDYKEASAYAFNNQTAAGAAASPAASSSGPTAAAASSEAKSTEAEDASNEGDEEINEEIDQDRDLNQVFSKGGGTYGAI